MQSSVPFALKLRGSPGLSSVTPRTLMAVKYAETTLLYREDLT